MFFNRIRQEGWRPIGPNDQSVVFINSTNASSKPRFNGHSMGNALQNLVSTWCRLSLFLSLSVLQYFHFLCYSKTKM